MREKGAAAFDAYYQTIFGESWLHLKELLLADHRPCFLIRTDRVREVQFAWEHNQLSWKPVEWYPDAIEWPEGVSPGTALPGGAEGFLYPLSPSSLLPVKALEAQPGHVVLDACAAPGGKTVAIAQRMNNTGKIIANDLSPDRVRRLGQVIQQLGIEELVELRQQPAEILARRIDMKFDRILIDAPCSSESHVIKSPKHLAQWSHKRIEELQRRQINMVTALLPLLQADGRLVYSTCALTPEEDEQVVEMVLQRMDGYTLRSMQKVRPDKDGFEPMFVAVFERK